MKKHDPVLGGVEGARVLDVVLGSTDAFVGDLTAARLEVERLRHIAKCARSVAVTYDVINGTVATAAMRNLLEALDEPS